MTKPLSAEEKAKIITLIKEPDLSTPKLLGIAVGALLMEPEGSIEQGIGLKIMKILEDLYLAAIKEGE